MKALTAFVLTLPVFAVATIAMGAQTAPEKDLRRQIAEVMARIKKRTPGLLKLKNALEAGETWEGLVEAVLLAKDAPEKKTADGKAKQKTPAEKAREKLLAEENADRKKLLELLAKKSHVTVENVRKNFAAFRFKKSASNHYFKGRTGQWLTKKEWIRRGPPGPFAKPKSPKGGKKSAAGPGAWWDKLTHVPQRAFRPVGAITILGDVVGLATEPDGEHGGACRPLRA